jgi:DNA-binding NarL/FixJ family response regulator
MSSRIFLIVNDPIAAARLRGSLDSNAGLQVVGWATTLAQACETIETLKPDLVLSDLELVDGPFSDIVGELGKSRYGRPQTMVLAPSLADGRVMDVMRQGVDGYFLLSHATEPLAVVVQRVLAGESPMATEIACQVKSHFDEMTWDEADVVGETQNSLRPTNAERLLLRLLAEGRSVDQIARDSDTAAHAVGRRVRLLYRKLSYDTSASTLSLQLI